MASQICRYHLQRISRDALQDGTKRQGKQEEDGQPKGRESKATSVEAQKRSHRVNIDRKRQCAQNIDGQHLPQQAETGRQKKKNKNYKRLKEKKEI